MQRVRGCKIHVSGPSLLTYPSTKVYLCMIPGDINKSDAIKDSEKILFTVKVFLHGLNHSSNKVCYHLFSAC